MLPMMMSAATMPMGMMMAFRLYQGALATGSAVITAVAAGAAMAGRVRRDHAHRFADGVGWRAAQAFASISAIICSMRAPTSALGAKPFSSSRMASASAQRSK